MKKFVLSLLLMAVILPSILAANLNVIDDNEDKVMVDGLTYPVTFNIQVHNNGISDEFRFYNLVGFTMEPAGYVQIENGQTRNVTINVYPIEGLDYLGYYSLPYGIEGRMDANTDYLGELRFKIVSIKDALEVGAETIDPESQTMTIYLKNKENFNFNNMSVQFSSPFFQRQETITLTPREKKTYTIQLNKEDFKSLMAGYYTLNARVSVDNKKETVEGIISFAEKDIVTSLQKDEGTIINTKVIRKTNEGNIVANTQTVMKLNIISRLFTTISPQPDLVERQGVDVFYTWNRQLKPGEYLDIEVKTNWLFPVIAILFILAIVILALVYTKTYVQLNKKVSFVRAKGGEFALKVTVTVRAKEYVEKVSVIDRLPPLTKIYEKFGGEQPVRVNDKSGRIEWVFDKMNPGETRVLHYIIYSKVGVLGKFALPSATAIYERDGEIKETTSNKAFFIAEQTSQKSE
ncbi:Uncharacterised protein [uncultured archaeon]|nr:Uncharacterised protein [uncultured archaeon]